MTRERCPLCESAGTPPATIVSPAEVAVSAPAMHLYAVADAPGFPEAQRFRSRATALAVSRGRVYGVVSGMPSFLVSVGPDGPVTLLSEIPETTFVRSTLVVDGNGGLCVGTTAPIEGEGVVQAFTHPEWVEPFGNAAAGHLLWVDPDAPDVWRDLGTVRDHEGIYALGADSRRRILYGVTFPSGLFFSAALDTGVVRTHGALFTDTRIGVDEYFRPVPRAVVVARDGAVWTSGAGGRLYRFDPLSETLSATGLSLPGIPGRQFLNVADALVADAAGRIYGGSSDGYLFELDAAGGRIVNLGKVVEEPRIRALTMGRDGALYGVAGSPGGICRLFRYDPRNRELHVMGVVDIHDHTGYDWLVYEIDAIAGDDEGRLYLAECEAPSHIAVLKLWESTLAVGSPP